MLKSDIVPRLLKDVPGQPTEAELEADRYRARFVILFDREGYSPKFFKEMWQTHRIACITYHKFPKDDWPTDEFAEVETTLPNGERVSLKLAERGTWIGDRKNGLWMRETRKLTEKWAPGQPDQHGLWQVGAGGFCSVVQSMVSGKLLPLHDGTLCH